LGEKIRQGRTGKANVSADPRDFCMGKTALKAIVPRIFLSPWLIVNVLAFGWGPLFVADQIRSIRPDLDAAYILQAIGMNWLIVTVRCTQLAILLALAQSLIWLCARARRDGKTDGHLL
jgi:hypothetical protein